MGLFDFLKKKEKEPEYDVTNLTVKDLKIGFILDYDLKSWVIKEMYEYDWGNNNFSYGFMLDSGDDVVYLDVEDKGEMYLTVTRPVKMRLLGDGIKDYIIKNESPPERIVYENETYYLESDSAGYFTDITKGENAGESASMISWELFNEDEDKVIGIIQWDERNIEASAGVVIKDYDISNIIPGQ
ncbi:MAG: DUF4178 domain-containing protein [Cyclobacteriaceae bacterium]|nr:DUF4178 domain-containing protein [Cyclobacteriaceae bacterium]